jgi:hypothetical protein
MTSIEELQAELQSLREEVRRLHVRPEQPVDQSPRIMSRRNLLRAAPVVAVGGALAAMSAGPAAASVGDPVLQGKVNNAGSGKTTTIKGGTPWTLGGVPESSVAAVDCDGGVEADWVRSAGVEIGTNEGAALYVNAPYMSGYAAHFLGGPIPEGDEVQGESVVLIEGTGPGVGLTVFVNDATTSEPGSPVFSGPGIVVGTESGTGLAVTTSGHGHAVVVKSTSGSADKDAVIIEYAGKGKALYVESSGTENGDGSITGINGGNGAGVLGQHTSTDQSGYGLIGLAGTYGRGAQLSGGAAALQLVPSTATTHPTNGKAGDMFVDSNARLWFCQKAGVGAIPATWARIV